MVLAREEFCVILEKGANGSSRSSSEKGDDRVVEARATVYNKVANQILKKTSVDELVRLPGVLVLKKIVSCVVLQSKTGKKSKNAKKRGKLEVEKEKEEVQRS